MKRFFVTVIIILGILGLLFYVFSRSSSPDKVIPATPLESSMPSPSASVPLLPLHTIGQVTRHATNFDGQQVRMQGYMLVSEKGYVIFSDESGGAISSFDLPVAGPGIDTLTFKQKYELQGKFIYGGLNASNHNLYHLELSASPQTVK